MTQEKPLGIWGWRGGAEGTSVGGSREWNLETPAEQRKAGSSCAASGKWLLCNLQSLGHFSPWLFCLSECQRDKCREDRMRAEMIWGVWWSGSECLHDWGSEKSSTCVLEYLSSLTIPYPTAGSASQQVWSGIH